MKTNDIAQARLFNQQITAEKFTTVKDLAAWMGAMQAQDYAMLKWALGVRLANASEALVEEAIAGGDVLRSHLLRPTWHLVAAEDYHWLLALSAPQLKNSLKTRHAGLGLTEAAIAQSNALLEKTLSGGHSLTREALLSEFQQAGIATADNRASHLLMCAELDGLVCSGPSRNGKATYALLSERVPQPKTLTRADALATLAKRYFTSHAPATLDDFTWWSGLPAGEARRALEMVKADFSAETIAAQTYWLPASFCMPAPAPQTAFLLPAYDEYIISYKDRRPVLPPEHHTRAISSNGMFWPVIVVNGQVCGLWKRTIQKERVLIEMEYFYPPQEAVLSCLEKAAQRFGAFLGKEVALLPLKHNT